MAIRLSEIRAAASRPRYTAIAKNLREAQAYGNEIVFLCHSHHDRDLVEGVQTLLNSSGWNAYVDWQDTAMPERPTRETAQRIQRKIGDCHWFLYLATPNSSRSRWCPWEIGYANGAKDVERILVISTSDEQGTVYGAEYLELYRRIDLGGLGRLAVFQPGATRGALLETLRR